MGTVIFVVSCILIFAVIVIHSEARKNAEKQAEVDEIVSRLKREASLKDRERKETQRRLREKRRQEEERKAIQREQSKRRSFMEEQRRLMSDSLRYDVMRRDGFRCQLCGATAKDGVKLHVDHIKPVSRGGKTEMSNLRTLCERCNLGKGAKLE